MARRPKPRTTKQAAPDPVLPRGVHSIVPLSTTSNQSYLAQCNGVIQTYGWMVQAVFDPKDPLVGYTYTVGLLRTFGHPELLIAGIDPTLAQTFTNTVAFGIKNGGPLTAGDRLSGIIRNFDLLVTDLDSVLYVPCVKVATLLEPDQPMRVFQLLYPDKYGVFPDHPECVETIKIMQEMYPERGGI